MRNTLNRLDPKLLRLLKTIGRVADQNQCEAYLVGGVVRDIFLRRKNWDLDIVIVGDCLKVARTAAKKWKARITVYPSFGTSTLFLPNGLRCDMAMARRERYPHAGSLPVVIKGRLKEDLFRRDFTINAMAISLRKETFGQLIDEYEGLRDLRNKRIRVLHDQSFIDDATRILRAIRFEQRLGFGLERHTVQLCKKAIKKNIYSTIKPARIFVEFKKVLSEEQCHRSLTRLQQLGALGFLKANFKFDTRVMKDLNRNILGGGSKYKTLEDCHSWLWYFIALFEKNRKLNFGGVLSKFPLTKIQKRSMIQSQSFDSNLRKLSDVRARKSDVYKILKPLNCDGILYLRFRTPLKSVIKRIDQFLQKNRWIEPSINGLDIQKLGLKASSRIGKIIEEIRFQKIDLTIKTRSDELSLAKKLIEGSGCYS